VSKAAAAREASRGRAAGLSVTIRDGVAWLRLDRPEAHNRVTQALAQGLCDAAAEIELDDRVVAVVLTASGSSFCVGVDDGGAWERRIDWVDAVARLTRPVIAAIQGDAVGEGLELALACDLRIASDHAHFAMPQLAGGRLPAHGGTQRLPRIVGRMRALDLLLTGRTVDATEAEAIDLVTWVVPHRELDRRLNACVDELQAKGPIALRYAKEAVLKGSDLTTDQGIRLEEDLYALLQTTRDRQEGINAFLQKRKPMFRGK
jgi:enoyl-CoA hydratase